MLLDCAFGPGNLIQTEIKEDNNVSEKAGLSALSLHRPSNRRQTIPPPPSKWFTRLVLPITILIIALLLLGYSAGDSLKPAVPVQTMRVVTKSLPHMGQNTGIVTVQAPGWVEADPFPIFVPALAPGVVEEVLVLEGQRVEAGQTVVRLIDDDARLALDRARAQLKNKEVQLSAAQSNWDFPIELDRMVAVSQASLQKLQAERIQLRSEIAAQEAILAELEDKYKRLAALLPSAIAEQQVIQASLQRDAQRAVVTATQKKMDVLDAQHLSAQADLEAAQEKRRLRIDERQALDQAQAELQQAEAALAEAQLRLERMNVRSPVPGVVMTRLVVPGSKLMLDMDGTLSANTVHLYDPKKLQVRVDVPLADAAKVGIDQRTEITVDVLPDRRFAGHVSRIVHEADIQKNTLQVKVAIHNPTSELKPEMLARVKFLGRHTSGSIGTGTERVLIPERLLKHQSGDSATVWLVTVEGLASQREITLGTHRQDGWVETVTGLQPGDTLIAIPPEGLKEGQRVRSTGEAEL